MRTGGVSPNTAAIATSAEVSPARLYPANTPIAQSAAAARMIGASDPRNGASARPVAEKIKAKDISLPTRPPPLCHAKPASAAKAENSNPNCKGSPMIAGGSSQRSTANPIAASSQGDTETMCARCPFGRALSAFRSVLTRQAMRERYDIHVIGGGLAGSEAAWQLAERGVRVRLSEMRGSGDGTPAHNTEALAELVCSNSFRSDDHESNAVGLLHHEMRAMGSLIMRAGEEARVPAGSAMAVDRDLFSAGVTRALEQHPNVELVRERIDQLPDGPTIVATGPLTAPALARTVTAVTGEDALAFFDALAPIVHRDSVDMDRAWFQSRWNKGDGKDYINCPLDREQYDRFVQGLLDGEKGSFKDWEQDTPYFEGCMPIEVMAERGRETLRYGPMKPVGLDDPKTACERFPQGRWPYAVVQLRQDNKLGTLWNMVGFQTKLKHGAQVELFRTIPGLERAQFARLGGLHRNTFLNAPPGSRSPTAAARRAAYPLRRSDHRM